jgi:hypothetical protein
MILPLVWLLIAALGLPPALAQKGSKKGSAGKTGAKKKQGKAKPKSKSKTPEGKKKKKAVDTLADLNRPPSMNINKPLLTKAEYDKLEKQLTHQKFDRVLRAGVLNGGSRKIIQDWAKWRVYGMTLAEHRDDLFKRRQKILSEIIYCGKLNDNAGAVKQFRTEVLKTITARCTDVLDNNYYVRLHAIMILGNMNLTEYDRSARRPPVAFGPAYKPLLEKVLLVSDDVQPESLKIAAAVSLKRIGLLAGRDPSRTREREMAAGLIKEFNRTKTHPWYQCRLAEAMSSVELKSNPAGEAIIVHALAKAVVNADHSRTVPVRAQAAMSLGRACLASDVNIDLLMHEIVNLSAEMSDQYNAELAAGKAPATHWPGSFLRLYFAFKPVDQLEKEYLYKNRLDAKDRYAGFLEKGLRQKARIEAAFNQIKPVVKHVLEQSDKVVKAPVPAATVAAIRTWLASHTPTDFRVQNGGKLPPLRAMRAALGKPKANKAVNGGIAGP